MRKTSLSGGVLKNGIFLCLVNFFLGRVFFVFEQQEAAGRGRVGGGVRWGAVRGGGGGGGGGGETERRDKVCN